MSNSEQREKSPLVSIVLPAYNVSRTIQECVSTLAKQDYPNTELIVVNDGSTDETRRILERLSMDHTMLVQNTDHVGRSQAKNLGAGRSRGEIIAFAEADAKYDGSWVSNSVSHFQDNVAAVVGPRYCWSTDTSVSKAIDLKLRLRYHDPSYSPFTGWAITRTAFLEVQGFDPDLVVAEDRDIGMRISKRGHKIGFAPGAVMLHMEPRGLSEFITKEYRHSAARTNYYRKYPDDYPIARVGVLWVVLGAIAYGMVSFWPTASFLIPPAALVLIVAQIFRLRAKARRSGIRYRKSVLFYASVLDYLRTIATVTGTTVAGIRLILAHDSDRKHEA